MTEAATTAAAFEGIGGAMALTLIAFTIVFLVLGGLTAMIYAMRLITDVKKKSSDSQLSSSSSPVEGDQEGPLIAAITAAIAAELGGAVRICSVTPVADVLDGWTLSGRMEALERLALNPWN